MREFANALEHLQAVWLEQCLQDLRFGLRALRRSPGFALAIVLTLAFGIGLNTVVFSVVNAVLIRPLPYPQPERLVWLSNYYPLLKAELVTGVDFLDWKAQAKSFEELVAYSYSQQSLGTPDRAEPYAVAEVTADFWRLSGAHPSLGRLFPAGERDALVISDGLFDRRFGRDPNAIGRAVTLNGRPSTIIGVLPREFRFVLPQSLFGISHGGPDWNDIEAYVLNPLAPGSEVRGGPMSIQQVAARLKPGVSLQTATAELERIQAQTADHTPSPRTPRLRVMALQNKLVGESRKALLILLAAVGFVLLIACGNISSLLLTRASGRQKEIAIRIAIGAGRLRMLRLFAAENLVLGLLGGVTGVILTRLTLASIIQFSPQALPRLTEANLDPQVLLFAFTITLTAVALFGLAPALWLRRSNLSDHLKQGNRTSGASSPAIRQLLVAGQIALAMVLLTGAGLVFKSFWQMIAYPPGFHPDRILAAKLKPNGQSRRDQRTSLKESLPRIQAMPGVEAAAVFHTIAGGPIQREGVMADQARLAPLGMYYVVSAGYGRVLGLPLLRGRWIADHESSPTVMINETYARLIFGSTDPIGQRIMVEGLAPAPRTVPATVVGIARDLRHTRLDAETMPEVYVPYQNALNLPTATLIVRTSGNPISIAPAIRRTAAEIDPTQTVEAKTLEAALGETIVPRRFHLTLFTTFALSALFLALVGIYGLIAEAVHRRTHEIGVRSALGAPAPAIVRMVVTQGMAFVLIGVKVGLIAAFGLAHWMTALLFEVRPTDPATFAAVALLLTATALIAIWIPARKAARIDPLTALRIE